MRLTTPKGAAHPKALFSPEEAQKIRERVRQGEPPPLIAREKGCHRTTITRIAQKISYRP